MNDKELLDSIERYLEDTGFCSKTDGVSAKKLEVLFGKIRTAMKFERDDKVGETIRPVQENLDFGEAQYDEILLYTDGACRGNPGPAAIGCVLKDSSGQTVKEFSLAIGIATNNIAEYRALIYGVELATGMKPGRLKIFSDSQLIVNQITGKYKVKDAKLFELWSELKTKIGKIENYSIVHIPREKNKRADQLANEAFNI